jgi:precorrin-8X/cobalt-precorrin-8 methylmutase
MWGHLAAQMRDDPRNANNRFDIAEAMNRALTGEAFPFWGNVREERRAHLVRRGRRPPGPGDLAERRLCDARMPRAKTVWQLAGAGSVGSQVLLGLPYVWRLRADPALRDLAAIWPFETGLADDPARRVMLAEAYPSLVRPKSLAGRPKDAGQVVALAEHFARLDEGGALAHLFGADPKLGPAERRRVIAEEAWILGVTGPVRPRR